MTERRSWRANAVLVLAGTIIGLVLLEASLRTYLWVSHGTTQPFVGGAFFEDERTGLRVPVPGSETKTIRINSLGFRGPEIPIEKPAHTVRIAFLGGSTTFCSEVSGNSKTWPDLVVSRLAEGHPHLRFDYVNAAVPGYATKQSLRRYEAEVARLAPDVVVVYHATNDLASSTRRFAQRAGLYDTKEGGLSQWLMTHWVVWKYVAVNVAAWRARSGAEDSAGRLAVDLPELERAFRDDLERLLAAIERSGSLVVVATFSHRLRPEALSDDELFAAADVALQNMPYMTVDGLVSSYAAMNEVIREVGSRHGRVLVTDEQSIPPTLEYFTDSFHFSDRGSELMAGRVLSVLQSSEEFETVLRRAGQGL